MGVTRSSVKNWSWRSKTRSDVERRRRTSAAQSTAAPCAAVALAGSNRTRAAYGPQPMGAALWKRSVAKPVKGRPMLRANRAMNRGPPMGP
jgi:hypothetical protein